MGNKLSGISISFVANGYILSLSFDATNENGKYTPFVDDEKYVYVDVKSVIAKITEIVESERQSQLQTLKIPITSGARTRHNIGNPACGEGEKR